MNKSLILCVCLLGIFSLSFAQEPPVIGISLVLVPEKHACSPNGYAGYPNQGTAGCAGLTIDQVEVWKKSYPHVEKEISASTSSLSLGDSFASLLESYGAAPKKNPDERKAIVVVFDWKSFQTTDVSLARKVMANTGQAPFPEMFWKGSLQKERRWIHHERADTFLPIHKVSWRLEANSHAWEFNTSP